MNALDPKYKARTVACARLDAAAQAVDRARRIEAAAAELVRTLEERAAQAEAAQATQLALLIARGGPTADLPTTPDEGLAVALVSARSDLSFKTQAVAKLAAVHADRQAELAAAEADIVRAVDVMLNEEREDLAAQIERLFGQLSKLVDALRESTPDPVNTPVNVVIELSPAVGRALSRVPPPGDINVPVDVLRGARGLGAASHEAWAHKRAR